MKQDQALEIVFSALKSVMPGGPERPSSALFLMKDLGLESMDLLNLFVEIERRMKTRLDLVEVMRLREEKRAYQRDLKIEDLTHFMIDHFTT